MSGSAHVDACRSTLRVQNEGAEQGWRGFFDVIAERLASD
jgi:hypothetical protein